MECLVTKLKGVVNDNNLRKLGEVSYEIYSIEAPGTGPFYFTTDTGKTDLSYRINRDDIDVTTGRTAFRINNIKNGDKLFIYSTNSISFYNISISSNGNMSVRLNGIYGISGKISISRCLLLNIDDLPYSESVTEMKMEYLQFDSIDRFVDIKSIYNKFPKISTLSISSSSLCVLNLEYLSKFDNLSSLNFGKHSVNHVANFVN